MLSSVPCSCSVTILLFNSSQRSLVLVKQFRPGEARMGSGGGLQSCFQSSVVPGSKHRCRGDPGEIEAQ